MRMYDLIVKKRDGGVLSKEEIAFMIDGYTAGSIPDYQMSAMMMAVYFRGMNESETLNLTMSMAHSGELLDLSGIKGVKVDKHSTGGVGDKTSLALTPMVAACGIKVAKMSGRGLGHTGGTIDKLESFPGFSTEISVELFMENVNRHGIAIMGQTKDLAPADKKLKRKRIPLHWPGRWCALAMAPGEKRLPSYPIWISPWEMPWEMLWRSKRHWIHYGDRVRRTLQSFA